MSDIVDFIIVGAAKSGTTAAMYNLKQHPKIHMPQNLEPHFFDMCWSMGEELYQRTIGKRPPDKLVGEKTPSYISFFPAHRNMHLMVPDAKLILFVRNPTTRAFSHWNHIRIRSQGDCLDFPEMISQSLVGLRDVKKLRDKVAQDPDKPMALDSSFMNIVDRGLYIDQIENLLTFFPREQLHVSIMERTKSNMQEEYNKILAFLGLEPHEAVRHDNYESGGYDGHTIDDQIKQILDSFYRPYNERLRKFLDDDIPEWD